MVCYAVISQSVWVRIAQDKLITNIIPVVETKHTVSDIKYFPKPVLLKLTFGYRKFKCFVFHFGSCARGRTR